MGFIHLSAAVSGGTQKLLGAVHGAENTVVRGGGVTTGLIPACREPPAKHQMQILHAPCIPLAIISFCSFIGYVGSFKLSFPALSYVKFVTMESLSQKGQPS